MLDWYDTAFDLIDTRSFSNVWFWIALLVMWSACTHWVIGVPHDMVQRARRHGGSAADDLHDLVRVNVNRLLHFADRSGELGAGLAAFVLSVLFMTGFLYGIEMAQALFLLLTPAVAVLALSVRTARGIHNADGADLYRRLARHRLAVQGMAAASIFVTSLWGMVQNLSLSIL